MHQRVEPLSDHPLFRALVLMGGSLTLGCGGVAQREAPSGFSDVSDGGAANAAAGGTNSLGGSGIALGGAAAVGGATQTPAASAGTAGATAIDVYDPSCPYAQWDCAGAPSGCYFNLKSKDDPLAAGCKCDTARPTSASACSADERFVCRQAFPPYVETQPGPRTWDGSLHVQCACVLAPEPNCSAVCAQTFGGVRSTLCYLPPDATCDEQGVCTATSADVLRQDGILCGCADIGLK